MWFKNLFKSLDLTSSRRRPTRRLASRLCVELLEDRWVPSFCQPVDIGADHTIPPGIGELPQATVEADFNGDGRLDLATALHEENTVIVVLGNGNGTFQSPRTSTCIDPWSIQAGDLNADGKADLVTWNNRDSIRVLLGNGDGTFQPPQTITMGPQISPGNTDLGPLPQYLHAVAIGDFNGDGTLDLVAGGATAWTTVAGYNEDGAPFYEYHVDTYANVLLGNGDGTFLLTGVKSTPNPMSPDAGDFNNDGRLDLLTAWGGGSSGGGVLPGNGDGTFGDLVPSTATIVGFGGVSHPVGDFNGDGNLDVLYVDSYYFPTLLVFGNGDGTFRPGGYFEPVGDLSFIATAVGDVNADGKLDIVAISSEYDNNNLTTTRSMLVRLGNGDGSFAPIVFDLGTFPGIGILTSTVLADFDGDGLPDLATADFYNANNADPGAYRAFVARNDGIWVPLPEISISDASVIEGQAGTVSAVFTVTLTRNPTGPVSVNFSTSSGSADATTDFDAQTGTLSFGPGVFSRTITVPVRGDRLGEGDEYFWVNLTNPANALIRDGVGEGNILDDEPRISINHVYEIDPLTVIEGDVGTTPAVFTVTLSRAYDQEVTVDYSTLTGHTSDIVAAAGTLRFLPGQTSKTITVQIVNDLIDEPLEAFNVILSNPTANATIAVNGGYCYIEDNDPSPPSISISDASVVEGNSGTKLMTFTVSLSQPAGQEVRVQFKTANGTAKAGSDYVAASGNVTIAAGQTSQTFTVAVLGDRSAEANETFFVNLSNPNYGVISDGQGVGTILDDEPRISISDATKAEGKKGESTLFTFTVTLSAAYDQAVTMSFRTVDGTAKTSDSDYIAKTGTLTFAPGETTKTITIEVTGDSKKEADETFYLDLFGNSSNSLFTKNRGLGTILNDD